jgi:hypothetical protein
MHRKVSSQNPFKYPENKTSCYNLFNEKKCMILAIIQLLINLVSFFFYKIAAKRQNLHHITLKTI